MGMTIEGCINYYNESFAIGNTDDDRHHNEVLEMTIDTLQKYQKIEEIYKNWCYPTHINAVEAMNKIGEVLKDGKA